MKVTVGEKDENNIVTLNYESDPGRAKDAYSKTLSRLGKNLTIKGFRKGKAPAKVIEDHFGLESIRAETLSNDFLSELLDEAFSTEDLNVVHVSNIEKVNFDSPDESIVIEAKVELFPEVELADYKKLKLKVQVPKNDPQKQFDDTMEKLLIQNSSFEESDGAVEMHDEIVFDFDGQYKKDDGSYEPKEGMKAEGFQTLVEEGRFIENFLEQMVGMKAGEEKEIDVAFPEAYHDASLAGKDAKFKVKVHKVSKPKKVEVDDEFAKFFGLESVAELNKRVEDEIKTMNDFTRRTATSDAIIDHLHGKCKVNLSDNMVSREMENDIATYQYQNGLNDDQIKDFIEKMDRDAEMAKSREKLEKSIILTTIIREQKFEVSQEEIQEQIAGLNLPPEFDTSKIDVPALVNKINLDLLTQKAVDFLIENADIDYEEVEDLHVHGPHCNH